MFLLDSNIVIYALQPDQEKLLSWLGTKTLAISAVTRVEVLGYHKLTETERQSAAEWLRLAKHFPVDDPVIEEAIRLRQHRRVALADALIASTAITNGLTLVTRNLVDFSWIRELTVVNPFEVEAR